MPAKAIVHIAVAMSLMEQPMQREYEVLYEVIEDGWIMATVPDLPGAVTQGQTMDEARANIREVIELLLESYREQAHQLVSTSAVREVMTVDASPR